MSPDSDTEDHDIDAVEEVSASVVVPENFHGARLDQVAAQLFGDYSRSRLQHWIREGTLRVDNACLRPRDKVSAGQRLSLQITLHSEVSWEPEAIPLDIIDQDGDVIVLNKPAGLVVHPAAGHRSGTLVNALLAHDPSLRNIPRAGIVHRLDKDTSGIMFVARSLSAHQSLVNQLAERSVSREYAAVCLGALTGGATVDAPIGRHPTARTKMAVVPSGKPAVTHYRVAARFGHHTQLQVNLETGRTHQIRVHMAFKKHPLLGDPVYGGRPRLPAGASQELVEALRSFPRQALHARHLSFEHPTRRERVSHEASLPEDMTRLIDVLSREDPNL